MSKYSMAIDFGMLSGRAIIVDMENGTPMCFYDEFKDNPHAYVKLWKHHAAQKWADELNALAEKTDHNRLMSYGGTTSCEWMLPKIMETLKEDENLYNKTYHFAEAADWIVWQLTGNETRNVCTADFKSMWNEETGYPSKDFFRSLDPRLENIIGDKLSEDVIKLSQTAGYITAEAAEKNGLKEGTPVAPAFIDAHAALPALGLVNPGELLMIIGTSTCHILLGDTPVVVPGSCGYVKDGIVDGLYAFEAGQACVDDNFDWFVKNCVPHSYYVEAEKLGMNIHKYLRHKAEKLAPGSDGIIALDWFNGNRTPYVNGNLSGTIVGLTVNTRPEQIYRALIEATAYGTRRIIELYEESGVKITKLYAAGGIAKKDEMLMQIYADVTGKEIFLSGTSQACALGSAILGAVNENGYATLQDAAENMKQLKDFSYKPDKENKKLYDDLYTEFKKLSEYFADKENPLMDKLNNLR